MNIFIFIDLISVSCWGGRGHVGLLPGGGACMVALGGGHVWLLWGRHVWLLWGEGMHG